MNLTYAKGKRMTLKELGYDERWLQKRIEEDTSIVGLGELRLIERERSQPTGGRIDFVLSDEEEDIRYEVEVMLGQLDPSHIIRTIEYWDIERTRYPTREHRAVIVAEVITSRYFNVISLLNRAVPIIVIQLEAIQVDDKVLLHFTKVLDISELYGDEELPSGEKVDRTDWQNRVDANKLALLDKITNLVPERDGEKHVAYNKFTIALSTSSRQFAWIRPRTYGWLLEIFATEGETRSAHVKKLIEKGVVARQREDRIFLNITERGFKENEELIREILNLSEQQSSIPF